MHPAATSKSTILVLTVTAAFLTILPLAGARTPAPLAPVVPKAPQFLIPPIFPTSSEPQQVAAADLNRDGNLDLAVTTFEGVDILFGNGDGTFQPFQTIALRNNFGGVGIAIADMNNDGLLDLIVTTQIAPSTVEILQQNVDGTFQFPKSASVSNGAVALAIADFNGDGFMDVAVTHPGKVGILLNDGSGSLRPEFNYATTANVQGSTLVTADFNQDGRADIALPVGAVNIFFGNGDGTFQPAVTIGGKINASQIALADVNQDSRPDIAVINNNISDNKNLGILISKGDGTFQPLREFDTGETRTSLALGDVNGDGRVDAVLSGQYVSVLPGKGAAGFSAPGAFYAGGAAGPVIIADLNGDLRSEVVQVVPFVGIAIYFPTASGTLAAPQSFVSNGTVLGLATADFNKDGKLDVAALSSSTISILLGNGNGTFQAPLPAFGSAKSSPVAADFNNDGNMDLAVLERTNSADALIYLGNGDGTFQSALRVTTSDKSSFSLIAADFNHDGKADLAVVSSCFNSANCQFGAVSILLGQGDGTFGPPVEFSVGQLPDSFITADFNNDGNLDIAVANYGKANLGNVSVLLGNGDGTFASALTATSGGHPSAIVAADFDLDGRVDLAVINRQSNTLSVIRGKGDGTFRLPVATPNVPDSQFMVTADFNGDGRPDLAVGTGSVLVFTGNGDQTFQPPVTALLNTGVTSLQAVEVTGDNRIDLVVGTFLTRGLAVVVNVTP